MSSPEEQEPSDDEENIARRVEKLRDQALHFYSRQAYDCARDCLEEALQLVAQVVEDPDRCQNLCFKLLRFQMEQEKRLAFILGVHSVANTKPREREKYRQQAIECAAKVWRICEEMKRYSQRAPWMDDIWKWVIRFKQKITLLHDGGEEGRGGPTFNQ